MTIYFYTKTDAYGDFSNFAKYGVAMPNADNVELWWSTVEHYFQAMKFTDANYQEKVRLAHNAKKAKAVAYQNRNIRADWDMVKDDIMYQAVLKKFTTHKTLKDRLLATGQQDIVENAPADYYWGCGADGSGLNKLGQILMRVREEL